jgi:hypothetical protein
MASLASVITTQAISLRPYLIICLCQIKEFRKDFSPLQPASFSIIGSNG